MPNRISCSETVKNFTKGPCLLLGSLMLLLSLFFSAGSASAADMEITPFNSFNQSRLVQIYGIPHDTGADIVAPGILHIALNQDLTSDYTVKDNAREQITLDGETYRLNLTARYGVASRWEAGFEIPYICHGGGFLDRFIINWHNTFNLSQGGRDKAPRNRVNYSYSKDGVQKLQMDRDASGIGDISLTGGFSVYDILESGHHDKVAVKGAVKLPSGDSSYLRGSGSTDLMLQICGSRNIYSDWGTLGFYGSVGALAMSRSDALRDQHKPLAGVGTLGLGWGPASWISFKTQINSNTSLYRDSTLDEISRVSLMVIFGGAVKFPGEYLLDIGVSEDLSVGTAPDVSFHLGLSKRF